MWWLGVRSGDVHLNISSPGWGKHAWSNFFSPFLAQATVFIFNYARFDAAALMRVMDVHQVTTFCAPPTVWRMLIQADLTQLHHPPRELVGAGEPLNPEVISQVRAAWGSTIRDGFGQTETTCWIGNSPGQLVKDGSMGRPLPGYNVELLDPVTGEPNPDEGEICLDLARRPLALMDGYAGDAEYTAEAMRDGYYHSGDIAARDADGYLTYVGRADDVFKASDYKISPFELESVLLEHPAVAEAAVVPSPHPVRAGGAEGVRAAHVRFRGRHRRGSFDLRPRQRRTCRATSWCASSSSPTSCPRPSRARSAGSTCAPPRRPASQRLGRHRPVPLARPQVRPRSKPDRVSVSSAQRRHRPGQHGDADADRSAARWCRPPCCVPRAVRRAGSATAETARPW